MEIFLPKLTNENSQTGTPKDNWETIRHISPTQRDAIMAFEIYISKLSQKLKDIDTKTSEFESRIDKNDEKVVKIKKLSDTTFNLVIVGFIALLIVVIIGIGIGGFLYGYLQVVNDGVARNDYKEIFNDKINEQIIENLKLQSTSSILEKQVKELNEENKILNDKIDCAKDKKYWQYEQCFNK